MPGPGDPALTQTQGCALMELGIHVKRQMLTRSSQKRYLATTGDTSQGGKEAESSTEGLSSSGLEQDQLLHLWHSVQNTT